MTNFERIKQMSVEEFASEFGDCMHCAYHCDCSWHNCNEGYIKYLNKEYEE